jgi:hypothetical protein
MSSKPNRVTERDVGIAVLKILANCLDGQSTVKHLREQTPDTIYLTDDDKEVSLTRDNEELWEQQVRNLKCHAGNNGNAFSLNYIETVTRGVWRITQKGRDYIFSMGS